MKNVNLDTYSPFHKTGHTSKGDQRKWKVDGIWYKADYMGYEGLAEALVSSLLEKSSLAYPFVSYQPVQIEYKGQVIQGCASRDFLEEGEILIPLEKLYRRYTGESLAVKLAEISEVTERIQYLTDEVEKITELRDFGRYLTAMLEIDAFFLNEDRHTNNIAVIYQEGTQQYALSPLFDQGLCLLADMKVDYPLERPLETCLEHVEAKPFSADFDEQLEAAEALYGIQLQFHFSLKEVQRELEQIAEGYPEGVRERVNQLLRQQIRKYAYLIKA